MGVPTTPTPAMTSSHPSSSEGRVPPTERTSSSFELLHERIQRWVWEKGWPELRDVQERAIKPILAGERDVILAAATAGGKTEAAFLPICTRLVDEQTPSIRALYVSPLKALINDQFGRLEELCDSLQVPVHRWHGDVPATAKRKLLEHPSGILLITPESLEALFVNQGTRVGVIFASLGWVVLDEVHAYIGTERGRQFQSLLHRVELAIGRRVPRVGLSATLGDMRLAAEYLRPGEGGSVDCIEGTQGGQELRVQIRAYREPATAPADEDDDESLSAVHAIADHLYSVLRGANHLVFANSRVRVERYADILRRRSESEKVPNEFFPHHGNLSKELREDVEAQLKDSTRPTTAICTSTLELGIDIGRVAGVAQVGSPFSASSLRQRLGRSGRRNDPAVLRGYVRARELNDSSPVVDALRLELVQFAAMVELLVQRWCEPPESGALHLSTLVHQVLSLVAERGGVQARSAWRDLCHTGPFRGVDAGRFATLLRDMGHEDLLTQMPDGNLILGGKGERIVNHFGFYAVFQTPEEFRLIHQGRPLGTMAFDQMLVENLHIVFAGRRWRVVSVSIEEKLVVVEPAPGGRMPRFDPGLGGLVHDGVRRRMRDLLESGIQPAYLDNEAQRLLTEGRAAYVRLGLDEDTIVACGKDTVLFPWRGDRVLNTIAALLAARGLSVMVTGAALTVADISPAAVRAQLEELVRAGVADPLELAASVKNKASEKYDWVLGEELLSLDYASRALDTAGAHAALTEMLGGTGLAVELVHRPDETAARLAELPEEGPLPRRTVILPNPRIAHQLRCALVRMDRGDLLAGTHFITAAALASELLEASGLEFSRGEEALRPARIRRLYEEGLDPAPFSRSLVTETRGWEDALSATLGDLEREGYRLADLDVAQGGAFAGLRALWEALRDSAGSSVTDAELLRRAAEYARQDPPTELGPVLAMVGPDTSGVELDLLSALPNARVLLRVGRPLRRRVRERIRRRFGPDVARALRGVAVAKRTPERDLDRLASRFMEAAAPVDEDAGAPDGTVSLEEHAGVEAEVEAAASWVASQVLDHRTPLEAIAVLAPERDPWVTLLCERIESLPGQAPEADVPVVVPGGLPLAASASGARVLAVVRALRGHLSVELLAGILPSLRTPEGHRPPSAGEALEAVHGLALLGGHASDPLGALAWSPRVRERLEQIAAVLAAMDEGDDGEGKRAARGRAELERVQRHLTSLRDGIDALVEAARPFVEGQPVHVCWPALYDFFERHHCHPPHGPPAHRAIADRMERLCADSTCREARKDEALALIERALIEARVPHGRFGEPAVYVGTVAGAAGLGFDAVRVIGLTEGSIPRLPREDPVLSDTERLAFLDGRLGTIEDASTGSLQELDLVVRDVRERLVFSSPRTGFGGEREASVVFLEAAVALGRERRSEVEAGRTFATTRRAERPVGAAAWHDRVARGGAPVPAGWSADFVVDPTRIAALDPGEAPGPMDGFIPGVVPAARIPGLQPERPLSASRFRTLMECPHRFLLEHVFGWREPVRPRPQDRLDALAYGSLVHRVLELLYTEQGTEISARRGDLAHWKAVAHDLADDAFTTALETYPLAGDDLCERERARLLRDVEHFLDLEWSERPPGTFVASEKPFGWGPPVEIVSGPLYGHGFIDLIEVVEGTTWIRDLKTGRGHARRGKERDAVPRVDAQLAFYALVARQLSQDWKLAPELALGYVHTDDSRGRERSFIGRDDDFEATAGTWTGVGAELLRSGIFPRTTDPDDCTYCPFRRVCGPGAWERSSSILATCGEDSPVGAFLGTRP